MIPKFFLKIFIITTFFCQISSFLFAEEIVINSSVLFKRAEFAFSQKDFSQAKDKYKDFLFFFPKDEKCEEAKYKISLSDYHLKNYNQSLETLGNIIRNGKGKRVEDSYFLMSKVYFQQKDYPAQIAKLHDLMLFSYDNHKIVDAANYEIFWTYLYEGKFDESLYYLNNIKDEKAYKKEKLVKEIDLAKEIEFKNPKIAGGLAVFPGAGYLYTNRYQDAFYAFLVNGLIIWAGVNSYENQNYGLCGLISFVGFGFYGGSIYGSVASTYKYNRTKLNSFIDNRLKIYRKDSLDLSYNIDYKNLMLSLNLDF